MITEDRVTFEIAKLLRDKGFPQNTFEIDCNVCYKYNGNLCNNAKSMSGVDREISYMAPTIQMVLKWLREEYNIHIDTMPLWEVKSWCFKILNISDMSNLHYFAINNEPDDKYISKKCYDTYEEAVEAALKYTLEHLI